MLEEAKQKIINRLVKTDDPFILNEVYSALEQRPENKIDDEDIRLLLDMLISVYKKVGKIPLAVLTNILSTRTLTGIKRHNWRILTIDDLMLSDLYDHPLRLLKIHFIGYKSINELNQLIRYLKSIFPEE